MPGVVSAGHLFRLTVAHRQSRQRSGLRAGLELCGNSNRFWRVKRWGSARFIYFIHYLIGSFSTDCFEMVNCIPVGIVTVRGYSTKILFFVRWYYRKNVCHVFSNLPGVRIRITQHCRKCCVCLALFGSATVMRDC